MTIEQVAQILNAEFICCEENKHNEVNSACGSDMMSDVLAYVKDQSVLITGLCNPQVVRTAEMMDMVCIVFVRGKRPSEEAIALAKQKGLVMMTTHRRMFSACGLLYTAGLKSGN
jgi:predicted transcriptional regulator